MKKLSFLLLTVLSLVSCFGVDCSLTTPNGTEFCKVPTPKGVAVNYLLPINGGDYELNTFLPAVEFPNGIPLQSNTIIQLNGVDITDDFNDWGISVANIAQVTVPINDSNTPIIAAAIRDGRNSFQVYKPSKQVVYFTVDVPGAEVHFLTIDDGWTGETFRINRTCGGNPCTTTINGVNVADRLYHPKRGNIVVEGYVDGEEYSNVTQLCVNTYTINSLGVQSPLASFGDGYSICDSVADGATNEAEFYVDFGSNGGVNYDFSFNIRDTGDNDTNYNENEVDVIEVAITDDTGVYKTQWLRSNVPLWDSRLNNDGGFSISFDHIAMLSTGIGVVDFLHGAVISAPNNGSDDIVLGGDFVIDELYIGNDSTINLTLPNQNSSNTSLLHVDANLEMRIRVQVPWWCLGGAMYTDTRNQFLPYSADVYLTVDRGNDPYLTRVTLANDSINLGGLKGGGLCGAFADLFNGFINDMVTGIVQNVVGGLFINDIPTTRTKIAIEVPDTGNTRSFGPFYMPIHPEITRMYGVPKGGTGGGVNNIKWGLMMGLNPRGSNAETNTKDSPAQRNPSMGIKWNGVPAPGDAALLAKVAADEGTPASSTTLGVDITEDFLNAIMLGLWESGMVYFDYTFDMNPVYYPSAFLYNLRATFATRQPWEIDLYPDGTPNGDAQLYFPDLVVQFLGDSNLPTVVRDYNLATMVADVYFNINIDASPDGKSIRIEVADALQIDVKEVSSDWDNTTEDELIYLLDQAFGYLSADFAVDIPFPEILSSTVDIKSVNSDEFALSIPIDVYNPDVYPNGPDAPMFAISSVQSIGPGVSIPDGWRSLFNNIDDDNSIGLYPFHVYANRDYTRSCRRCGWCGCGLCGCNEWNPYYWTEGPFEWGFRLNLNGSYNFDAIQLDRRNDCCNARGEGYSQGLKVRAYNGGVLQGTWFASKGAGTGVMTVNFGGSITADRFEIVVPINSGSDTYPNSRMWTGSNDHVLNLSEVDFVFTP